MTTFNLQKHLDKIASNLVPLKKEAQSSYEGAQGYFVAQTRSWQNCVRRHMLKGESAQEAWQNALDEYQKTSNNMEWISKNCVEDTLELQKKAQSCGSMPQMGSYLEKIKKHHGEGKSLGQSVMAALKDCEVEAKRIHESASKQEVKTAGVDPFAQWKENLKKVIIDAINKAKADGTTGMSMDNLMMVVRPPAGGPTGTNLQYHYKNDFFPAAVKALPPAYQRFIIAASNTSMKTASVKCQYELGGFHCTLQDGHEGEHSNPDWDKKASTSSSTKTACGGCGCGGHGNSHQCKCSSDCECKKTGGTCLTEKVAFSDGDIMVEARK